MKYCKRCVIPDTRLGIEFEDGVCAPCLHAEERKTINWEYRQQKLRELADKYRKDNGEYDCIIPGSGGKDTYFQTMVMKQLNMNPLIVKVRDSFTPTKTGEYNLYNMCDVFNVDLLQYNLNHSTCREMTKISFEKFGSPNYPIDLAIYSVPLKIAHKFKIPLIIYGENIAYEYGGPDAKETYSAKDQIKNDVVKPINTDFWKDNGITEQDLQPISYPSESVVNELEPIYLSYFYNWDGRKNYNISKTFGFRSLENEWKRQGFIENFDQIDSIAYLLHPLMKYPKFGHARATDMACNWIRNNYITREEAIPLVKEHDHKLDKKIVDDFINFTGYTREQFYKILDKHYNTNLFKKVDNKWKPRFDIK